MSTVLSDLTEGSEEEQRIVPPKHKFKIKYTLEGREYLDEALSGILAMRGIDYKELPREKIEEVYLDLSYYKTTLLLSRKELLRVYIRARGEFAIWMAKNRKKARTDLQEIRKLYKIANGIKMPDITSEELNDQILSDEESGQEYLAKELVVEELKEDMSFLNDQIKDIDSRRIQLQSIVKFRFG